MCGPNATVAEIEAELDTVLAETNTRSLDPMLAPNVSVQADFAAHAQKTLGFKPGDIVKNKKDDIAVVAGYAHVPALTTKFGASPAKTLLVIVNILGLPMVASPENVDLVQAAA